MYFYLLLLVFLIPFASSSSATANNIVYNKFNNNNKLVHNNNDNNDNNNNNNEAFDINEVYTQLMYSYSAYCPTSLIQPWSCFFCNYNKSDTNGFVVTTVIEHNQTNTFAFVGFRGTTVEVVFRGTQPQSLQNWISDLHYAELTPYADIPNAMVHSGFLDTYNDVAPAVRSAVASAIVSSKATRVVFTGHSLGAALTTLAAIDIAPTLKIDFEVYNFGSPRVGNKVFADFFYNEIPNTFRVVNEEDIVPHLPTELMGFHHTAQEIWWKNSTTYEMCNLSGEDPTCSDSQVLFNIQDHLTYLGIFLVKGGCA